MKSIGNGVIFNWLQLLVFGVLLTCIYLSPLSKLIGHDWNREDYTYAWLVPVLVMYLIWDNRKAFAAVAAKPSWAGCVLLLLGLTMFWVGELGGEYLTMYLSLTITVIALCWVTMGWRKLKTIIFALLLSLTMYPPPTFLHNQLTFKLKLISSEIGVWLLHLYGMSAYREGNSIDLGFTQLQVVDACSGLRYLFPLIVLALLLAYFYKAALWKKAILLFSAVPLTILINAFRIALTGILFEVWGPAVAEGFFHGFSGWFIFMFGLIVLLIEMWVLGRLGFGRRREGHFPTVKATGGLQQKGQAMGYTSVGRGGVSPQSIVALLFLGATLAANQMVDFREKIPPSIAFSQFPVHLGKWNGQGEDMEQKFLDTLDLSDYAIINYQDTAGRQVNFYTAYYQSQTKGKSIHSPATCLPGGGWIFEKAGTTEIAVSDTEGEKMAVNRAFMRKGDSRQLSYYWFPQRDRILTTGYQVKWFNFWDAFTRQRTDGALVRLITPVYPNEEVASADARLVDFTQEVVSVLEEFLPE